MLSDSYVKKEFTQEESDEALKKEREDAYLAEAGLEDRDTIKLRKTMLSAEEAVCAKEEQMTAARQARGRKADWEEFVDAKRRMGRVMHHSEFFTRLRRILPGLILREGRSPNSISMFLYNRSAEFVGDLGQRITGGAVFIGWVNGGEIPEYEIDVCNSVQVPIGQKRGWRTILLRLQCAKNDLGYPEPIVRECDVLKEFGDPTNGNTASYYRMQLWNFRNGRY